MDRFDVESILCKVTIEKISLVVRTYRAIHSYLLPSLLFSTHPRLFGFSCLYIIFSIRGSLDHVYIVSLVHFQPLISEQSSRELNYVCCNRRNHIHSRNKNASFLTRPQSHSIGPFSFSLSHFIDSLAKVLDQFGTAFRSSSFHRFQDIPDIRSLSHATFDRESSACPSLYTRGLPMFIISTLRVTSAYTLRSGTYSEFLTLLSISQCLRSKIKSTKNRLSENCTADLGVWAQSSKQRLYEHPIGKPKKYPSSDHYLFGRETTR